MCDSGLQPIAQTPLQIKKAFSVMDGVGIDHDLKTPLQKNLYMYRDLGTVNNNL
jgi:hypothetical protein